MKKLCILLSVLLMICMLGSVSVYAAGDVITLSADKTEVNVGDTVTITVGITNEVPLYGTAKVVPEWDGTAFEFVSGEADSTTYALTNATTFASNYATTKYQVTFSQKVLNTEERPTGENVLGTFTLKALKAGTTNISLNSSTSVYVNAATTTNTRTALSKDITLSITAAEAGGNEEVFEAYVEGTPTVNLVSIYAKNPSKAVLAAGTYGVKFGGKTYPAGLGTDPTTGEKVSIDCPADGSWVVQFVDENGTVLSGTYNWQAYYTLDGNEVTTDIATVPVQ